MDRHDALAQSDIRQTSGHSVLTDQALDDLRKTSPLQLGWAEFMDERMVLAAPPARMSAPEVVKAMRILMARSAVPCVCVILLQQEALASALAAAGIPFVTALSDTLHPKKLAAVPHPGSSTHIYGRMSPAARQAFVWLTQRPWQDTTANDLVYATGMPRTTAQRAMSELRDLTPMSARVGGLTARAIVCRVDNPQAFVEEGRMSFGRVPVSRKLVAADEAKDLPLAGASALAMRSRLVAPAREIRACSRVQARELASKNARDEAVCELLVLPYDPVPLATAGVVDNATMVLTCDEKDAMVVAALSEALSDKPWLMALM